MEDRGTWEYNLRASFRNTFGEFNNAYPTTNAFLSEDVIVRLIDRAGTVEFTGRSADHSANAESNMCFAIRYV